MVHSPFLSLLIYGTISTFWQPYMPMQRLQSFSSTDCKLKFQMGAPPSQTTPSFSQGEAQTRMWDGAPHGSTCWCSLIGSIAMHEWLASLL